MLQTSPYAFTFRTPDQGGDRTWARPSNLFSTISELATLMVASGIANRKPLRQFHSTIFHRSPKEVAGFTCYVPILTTTMLISIDQEQLLIPLFGLGRHLPLDQFMPGR